MGRLSLLAMLIAAAFVFTGCDDENTKEAKEYDRQLALDDGDFVKVLELTADCATTDYACRMDRAAAYAGRAGFNIPTILTAMDSDGNTDEYYQILGDKMSTTASDDLNLSQTEYEAIIVPDGNITMRNLICTKDSAEYNASGYYERASCFPHSMVTMAKTAVLMSDMEAALTLDANADVSVISGQVATLINEDLGTLLNLFGAETTATVEEIDQIKQEICIASGAGCDVNNLLGSDIEAFVNANKE